jgi:hypothetical protein
VLLVLGTSCIIVENCRAYKENMRKCLLSTTLFATTSIKQRPHLHFTYRSIKSINMSTQEAVVHVSENVAECKSDVPIPKLSADNWVLVKTKAVALNPTDWKNIAKATSPGSIAGCDYAGVVEEVGKSVTNYKIGDRICGFVRGGLYIMVWTSCSRSLLTVYR